MSVESERIGKGYLGWQLYLGAVLILAGVLLRIVFGDKEQLEQALFAGFTEFGIAFIVAHVIIVVVDRREKQKFRNFVEEEHAKTKEELALAQRRLATRGVVSYLLGTDIPISISDELENYLLNSKIVKRWQHLTFELIPIGKFTKLAVKAEALYENTRHESYDWEPPYVSFGEDHVSEYFAKKLPEVKFGIKSDIILLKKENESEFKTIYDMNSDNKELLIKMKSYKLDPGDQVRVVIYEKKARFGIDNEIFTNFAFCEKMDVALSYDKKFYDVRYRAIHPKSEVMHTEPYIGGEKLVLDVPFMPSNGILIWWKRREKVDTAQ
jgi:hypothetical protein